jgi:iron complex outermembrane receptor protein
MQKNAEMDGYELEIGNTFGFYRGELLVSFGFDSVSAEFSDGSNIPRIAPERSIYKITYSEEDLKILLSYKDIGEQDDVGLGETSTAGYDMLDMRVTKTIEAGNGTLNISVFGSNLLDEVARNHSSFVKNEVPLAGRSYGAKFTYKF